MLSQQHQKSTAAVSASAVELAKLLASARADDSAAVSGDAILRAVRTLSGKLDSRESVKSPELSRAVRESNLLSLIVDSLVEILEAGKSFDGVEGNISYSMLVVLLNFTNWSPELCRNLSEQDSFFKIFYPKLLSGQDAKQLTDGAAYNTVYYTIGIVFNAYFKNDSEIFARLSEFELVDCTKPYLQCKNANLSTVALVLIAFAVDEKNVDIFLGAKENIAFMIENLKNALTDSNRTWRGYDALEAAKCIRRLALNDSNKDLLIELNLLPVVQQMLSSKNDSDVAEGIEILFTLSFSKKFAPKIRSEFQEIIAKLQASEKWRDSKQLQGLVFQLQEQPNRPGSAITGKASSSAAAAAAKNSRKVMISYNHGSRPVVERLYRLLVEAQLEVWVDFNDMKGGSVYQAMANGIESSSVVLLCITRLYNESSNCRLEVEYAHECGKKLIPLLMEPKYRPSGWLGLLTRAELRYDLTETKCPFDEKAQELLAALRGHFNAAAAGSRVSSAAGGGERHAGHGLPAPAPILPPIVTAASPRLHHQQQPPPPPSKAVRAWDSERVAAWCRENQLPDAVRERGLTGVELQFLVNTMARSPEYFGRVMEAHFGFSKLLDLATFVAALEDLLAK